MIKKWSKFCRVSLSRLIHIWCGRRVSGSIQGLVVKYLIYGNEIPANVYILFLNDETNGQLQYVYLRTMFFNNYWWSIRLYDLSMDPSDVDVFKEQNEYVFEKNGNNSDRRNINKQLCISYKEYLVLCGVQ